MKLTGLTNLTNYEEKGNGKTIQNIVHSMIDISNGIYYVSLYGYYKTSYYVLLIWILDISLDILSLDILFPK